MRRFKFYMVGVFLCLFISLSTQAYANIVLKVIAVNPSKEQVQRVPVKAYLPKEAKPENVVDKGDLEIAYDTQQGSYYIYGEYELKPGEIVERDIEIRDIWTIPETEITPLKTEINKLYDLLKNTEFSDRISFLKNNIESKLNQVQENQLSSPANPERHISDFRENLKILDSVKSDLVLARSFMNQVKLFPSSTVWKIIIIIVLFLGILGGSFYMIWQKQIKTIKEEDTFFKPAKEGEETPGEPLEKEEEGEKEFEAKDIDKILNEEEKPKEEPKS
ncbi:MAG: hypothetical protein PHO70_00925 [Candidatus Omnitrophica bacterium]|nr:hypothetical protein [Candidatus Omnitrophota bacterium]